MTEKELLRFLEKLARKIARQYIAKLPANISFDDLMQVAWIEGWCASSRYDSNGGASLETFVTQRMRGAILDKLRKETIHTRDAVKWNKDIKAATLRVEQRVLRAPRAPEVALEMGLDLERYFQVLADSQTPIPDSLSTFFDEDFEEDAYLPPALYSLFSVFVQNFEEAEKAKEREEIFQKAFADLAEQNRTLLLLCYHEEMNYREIGALMKVTQSRVCQLEKDARAKLARKVRNLENPLPVLVCV